MTRDDAEISSARTDKLIPNIYIYMESLEDALYAVVTALFIRYDTVRR